jgi:hypothetical protein
MIEPDQQRQSDLDLVYQTMARTGLSMDDVMRGLLAYDLQTDGDIRVWLELYEKIINNAIAKVARERRGGT